MTLGKKMFDGAVWSAVERVSLQILRFVLGIILARLLTPTDYGLLGILLIFTAISAVFIDSGFSMALIQKKDRTQKDISTAFVFNLIISVSCYTILYIGAPWIADFYNIGELTLLLRVLALSLIISGLYTIPNTLLTINLDFKTLAKINLSATLLSGIVAISLAYTGFGVWALVWQTIIRSITMLILTLFYTSWKISFVFDKSSFKALFRFGSNILASSLLARFVSDISSLVIGKLNSARELGIFTRGIQFPDFFSSTVDIIINKVLLPGLAPHQDNIPLIRNKFSRVVQLTSLISFPLFFGLSILAEPLIVVLLTDKWLPAVPIMQVFCFARLIAIFCSTNVNILYVIGRSDLVLKQQSIAILMRVIFVGVALKFGIFYIALAELMATTTHLYINAYYPGKKIGYTIKSQLKDMWIYFFFATLMLSSIYLGLYFIENNIVKLIVGSIIGILGYTTLILLFRPTDIALIKQLLKKSE